MSPSETRQAIRSFDLSTTTSSTDTPPLIGPSTTSDGTGGDFFSPMGLIVERQVPLPSCSPAPTPGSALEPYTKYELRIAVWSAAVVPTIIIIGILMSYRRGQKGKTPIGCLPFGC
ncbi:hypothetical protein PM082_021608 [Marasmius tenuissimus]|nr:hypothetical protein PM082_021608 [Marasmius tenuissimus]